MRREIFLGPRERVRVYGQSGGRGVGELQFKFIFMTDRTGGRRAPRRGRWMGSWVGEVCGDGCVVV